MRHHSVGFALENGRARGGVGGVGGWMPLMEASTTCLRSRCRSLDHPYHISLLHDTTTVFHEHPLEPAGLSLVPR